MGLSSKTTKTESTVKPVFGKEIMGAASAQQNAYDSALPNINRVSGNMLDLSDDLLGKFGNDSTINASRGYIEDTLAGDPASNPALEQMTQIARDRTRNDMQARMGTRGQTGGSDYYGNIGKGMYEVDTGLRYQDYNQQQQRRAQAAGMAPGVVAGDYIPVAAGMQAGQQGALLPLQAALANSAGVGGLLGQYTTSKGKQTSNPGLLDIIGTGLQAASVFCDARLKENAVQVDRTPGGVPIYHFNYIGDETVRIGPMAQEVAALQPKALGPVVDGYMTVNIGELR